MLFQKPIDLRHMYLFYLGHTPTFLDICLSNLLNEANTELMEFKSGYSSCGIVKGGMSRRRIEVNKIIIIKYSLIRYIDIEPINPMMAMPSGTAAQHVSSLFHLKIIHFIVSAMLARTPRKTPLLSFSDIEMRSITSAFNALPHDDSGTPQKLWYEYLPLCGTVIMLLAPHPSWLYVLVDFHLQTMHQPFIFTIHILVTYTLTFMIFSSLIVCVTRDPGPVHPPISELEGEGDGEEMDLTEALMPDRDFEFPGRWCRKCWAPKPERTHHCSACGRCVLKMDHHCPWLGSRCIGHRTYPAFLHFLCSVTCFALYIAVVAIHALMYAFQNPFTIHELTPVHEICLAMMGVVFSLVIGSFAGYHLYLISTNQTTLENTTPFMILRHLPPLPQTGHSLSDPPLEAELSYNQRRLVRDAHSHILPYDIGFRKNWAQVFGWNRKYGWLYRLWYGGSSMGEGKTFPRNHRSDEMLARLANELVKADANN